MERSGEERIKRIKRRGEDREDREGEERLEKERIERRRLPDHWGRQSISRLGTISDVRRLPSTPHQASRDI